MVALTSTLAHGLHGLEGASAKLPDACVHHLFEQQVERTPDAVAVVCENQRLSYGELNRRANQVARFLHANGVVAEDLVGVCMTRRPELAVALLGVWKAGAAYVPIDPGYPQERVSFMVSDASIRVLLTEKRCEALFTAPTPAARKVVLDGDDAAAIAEREQTNLNSPARPSSLAYVMYTSGSTGRPKGAMIEHGGLVNYLTWAIEAYGVEAGGSVPVHSSIAFDLTVTSLYPALLTGGSVELLADDVGAAHLLAAARRGPKRTLVKITPAHLDVMTQQLRPDELADVTRVFVIGGESLPAESLGPWRDRAPETRLINEYGPTETVVGCCVYEVRSDDPRNGPVPIGRPIANTQLHVLDEERRPVPVGSMGELYIGGAGVARGYLNRPELTKERFVPDSFSGRLGARLYKTGDLARQRADGTLEFLGRADNQVKVRGYRIELGEIEACLASHPAVQSCVVLAREDTPGNKQLVGYVVSRAEKPRAADVDAFLAERLPEYMVPTQLVFLDALPLTINGKVDRAALPAPSAGASRAPGASNAGVALSATEQAIAAIWRELLKREDITSDSDFFEMGGHSLLAVKTLAMIRDGLGVEIPLQALFESSTLAGLAALVDQARGGPSPQQTAAAAPIPRRSTDGPCPVSFAQQQMWLLHHLVPNSPAYNIMDVVRLSGSYDASALRKALRELITRHEVLRTSFSRAGGDLVQIVHPPFDPELSEIDLVGGSSERRAAEWARIARELGRTAFDLSRLPLLRVAVVHDSSTDHQVFIAIHHTIADEWSMELVHQEMSALYDAFAAGRPTPLPALPIQYADYSAWQRERMRGEELDGQLRYWSDELRGAMTTLAIPTDRPRPTTPTGRGATERFFVPRSLIADLDAAHRQEQTTSFMVLEAAFAALMHRLSGQHDVLVGTPISGRTRSETQRLIGCFLNTVVLRSQFDAGTTFRSLLEQVRKRALGAYAHADVPFERLVAELAPTREPGRTPLFQVMFILHDRDGVSEVATQSSNTELENGTSKFDLTMYLSETEDGLKGSIEYSTDLFEAETIRRMCRSYRRLLESIAREPDRKISEATVLANEDRRTLLSDWNRTSIVFDDGGQCLHGLLARQAGRSAERTAIVAGGERMSYRELHRRSDDLARHLKKLGVGPDVLAGLLVERSTDMMVGLLGILKAGGAYVPLDPTFPPDRLAHMIEDSRMPVLITHRGLEGALAKLPASVVHLDRDAHAIAASDRDDPVQSDARPENLAYVLYTSGSTGKPKGVAIPHSAIVNFLLSMEREPGLGPDDTLLAVTTLSFDIAGLELYLPLVAGAQVVIANREDVVDPHRLMRLLREHRCTVMQATPATWRALVAAGWEGSRQLKALCGGEAFPPELAKALLPRCRELWNMYGPTETTVWSTVHRVTSGDGPPPIGKPIANTQVYVLTAGSQLAQPGATGELCIGGTGLARGYLFRDELTCERFVPNPFEDGARIYRTGDMARWRFDGVLECLGRTDHQVKVRGYRIELGEIEHAISQHPGVRQVVVVAREDAPGDKRLVAYVVAPQAPAALMDELRARLRGSLPDYMVPALFVLLETLPLTPNGKIDRKALPAPAGGAGRSDAASYVAPTTELETSLAVAWEHVLGIARVGIHDNFFDLGGDSLKVLNLIVEMERNAGIDIDLGAVFKFPTIATLVKSLGDAGARDASMAVALQPEGDGPPVFCLCGISMYRDFAASLGKDQPVFGVYVPEEQALAKGAMKGAKVHVDVATLARSYCDAIRRVLPNGPYRLAGSSFGGIVALEVASMLRREGVDVEIVALLDTLSPRGIRRNWVKWFYRRAGQVIRGEAPRKVLRELSKLQDRLVARGWLPGVRDAAQVALEAHALKQEAYFAAIGTWKARRLVADFQVVLFRATEQHWGPQDELDEDYGWHHYLSGPLAIVDVVGDHLGILKPPYVQELGRRVREHLFARRDVRARDISA